jgi:AcrR family transcriptional regulator
MGHKHTREQILAAALAVATDDGLHRLSFGRVAAQLGISDRVVVYYFASKNELVTAVLEQLGAQMQQRLALVATTPAHTHLDLVRAAWPVLARADADRAFALYFQAAGLAAAGVEPYSTAAAGLIEAWIDWFAASVHGSPEVRRAEAVSALALIDGLLLLRQLGGPDVAGLAARRLGAAAR